MSEENNSFEISRRKTLAALGTIGAASAGAGLGTSAWFSDTETFEGNTITAGELDLKVDWRQTYTGPNGTELVNAYPGGNGEGMDFECSDLESGDDLPEGVFGDQEHLVELDDVKPGDEGEITFSLHLCDNPGYLWMTLENIAQGPGETPEPEPEPDEGELAENLYLEIWKESDCNNELNDEEPVILGEGDGVHTDPVTLAQAKEELAYEDGMIVLSGDGLNGWNIPAGAASRTCFEGDEQHCIGVRWWIPETVGNVIQGDTLEFDLGFYTEQCRHNQGCAPRDIGLNTGDGGWEITDGPQTGTAMVQTPHAEWIEPSDECAWIAPPEEDGNTDANGDQDPQGTYTFETDFEVDLQETPAGDGPCKLKFDAATDNTATFYLDDQELGEITGPSSDPDKGFKALETFEKEITAGEHTLVAEVENAEAGGSGWDNPVGLLVCGGVACGCEEESSDQNS
ncbi:SipW-dependent-type signal peptide-containing protein [Halodesulfurarchaeum formicicum]|uniref:von Willebrand factor type A n=1 Tax=Halodesulfurarchaeum formicicum TaxID=1873524 RepID=A0A1J1ACB9_9EURY|nr:SipW-dependent-type signal peptide-containing protein [Halodesulfurarchaeum formicicum]APE95375.1 hypothetical protein HSR6_0922 [Halodesulfurarchaeum formicicum]